jgi:6-phosphogluconolactonase
MKTLRTFKNIIISIAAFLLTVAGSGVAAQAASNNEFLVYIGTYTGAKSKGIYVSRLDTSTGKLSSPELAAETVSPSFLAIHPNRRFLYAVGEIGNFGGKKSGAVSSFSIDPATGKLALLNQQASGGDGPCHLVVDSTGKNVLVANYGGGSISALPIKADGSLAESTAFIQHQGSGATPRQSAPHAHSINLDSGNRFAAVADLGLDKVLIYRFDPAKGTLTPNDPPSASVKPGAGPRHFAFHPKSAHAYVINEIQCTMTAFSYDPQRGELKEIQTISTLPPQETVKSGYSTAEVQVHPSGKFLYGSNRGHDTIVAYAIDEKTGRLTYVENESTQGKTPRNFGIDPTGTFLLAENQGSGTIVVFRIDPATGQLNATGNSIEVPSPVCVKFVPVAK